MSLLSIFRAHETTSSDMLSKFAGASLFRSAQICRRIVSKSIGILHGFQGEEVVAGHSGGGEEEVEVDDMVAERLLWDTTSLTGQF